MVSALRYRHPLTTSKEQWQEDSSLSIDAQREEILAKYVTLGVRGRQVF
jgi:hypothetical protein